MKYGEKSEFIIYPRSLDCLKFNYKGQYFFRFSLRQQKASTYTPMHTFAHHYDNEHTGDKNNTNNSAHINYAYPHLARGGEKKAVKEESKRAKNYVNEEGVGIFETKR